jgi:UDP-3-O-[3-hydroxymyristoyl] N-acetylglucosamine deacetylase
MQHTINQAVSISGIGVHSGIDVTLTLNPADVDTGIVFVRDGVTIPARWDYVVDTRLCTVIAHPDHPQTRVATIEHLMAALRALGVDNLSIDINAEEVPIMDGSAQPFMDAIDTVGIQKQNAPRKAIKILKEIKVTDGDKEVTLSPSIGCVFSGEINFDHPMIGRQFYKLEMLNGFFRHDIARARTFGFLHEVEMLRKVGLARGGSLDNAIVFDHEKALNPDGLRFKDECIRHKLLDAVGDIYMAGAPILGLYHGVRIGHEMNNRVLRALFADAEAWMSVDLHMDLDEALKSYAPQDPSQQYQAVKKSS